MSSFSEETELGYFIGVIKRRFWQMALPAVGVFIVIAVVVMLLPAKYQSSATIQIEGQEVPQELVRSAVTGFVEERLQSIMQVVLNRTNLMSIIDRVGLYADQRKTMPAEQMVDMMRKDIVMKPITAEVMNNSGRPATATIAFSLEYEGRNPQQVLQTTSILVSLFLEENLRKREAKAETTYTFLDKQLSVLRDEVHDTEARIARFKELHLGALPELTQLNLQTLERIERDAQLCQETLRGLVDRRAFLEGQLAIVTPQRTLETADGKRILPPSDELRSLQTQYVALTATRSEKHPDVIRMRQQIAALQGTDATADTAEELNTEKSHLADLQAKYGPAHPDVQAAERRVAALEKSSAAPGAGRKVPSAVSNAADNPAWVSLKSQLQATDTDIRTQQAVLAELRGRQNELTRRLEEAPRVEQEYRVLEREHLNAQAKYQETSQKLLAARESKELELERAGEKMTIIDPPLLPEKPAKPKRMLLLLVGVVLSLGCGVGCGALFEVADGSLRGARAVAALTTIPVLGVVPYLQSKAEIVRRKRNRRLVAAGICVLLLAGIALFHVFILPLDVLYYQLMNRYFPG